MASVVEEQNEAWQPIAIPSTPQKTQQIAQPDTPSTCPGTPSLLSSTLRSRISTLKEVAAKAPKPSVNQVWPGSGQPPMVSTCRMSDESLWEDILVKFGASGVPAAREALYFEEVLKAGMDANSVAFPQMQLRRGVGLTFSNREASAVQCQDSVPFPLLQPLAKLWTSDVSDVEKEVVELMITGRAKGPQELREAFYSTPPLNTELSPWTFLKDGVVSVDECTDAQLLVWEQRSNRSLPLQRLERRRAMLSKKLKAELNPRIFVAQEAAETVEEENADETVDEVVEEAVEKSAGKAEVLDQRDDEKEVATSTSEELRVDHDGAEYTLADFIQEYGGSVSEPPQQWIEAQPAAPVSEPAEVERRLDTDGNPYTLQEFMLEYGGTEEAPPSQWQQAQALQLNALGHDGFEEASVEKEEATAAEVAEDVQEKRKRQEDETASDVEAETEEALGKRQRCSRGSSEFVSASEGSSGDEAAEQEEVDASVEEGGTAGERSSPAEQPDEASHQKRKHGEASSEEDDKEVCSKRRKSLEASSPLHEQDEASQHERDDSGSASVSDNDA